MKTAAEIVREFDPRGHVGDPLFNTRTVVEDDPAVWEARRKRRELRDNSVDRYRKSRPSAEFDTKEERDRWGCRLSVAPQGYSGQESGTSSVIRSIIEDDCLMRMAKARKRAASYLDGVRTAFERDVFPKFVELFSGNDPDGGMTSRKFPLTSSAVRRLHSLPSIPSTGSGCLKTRQSVQSLSGCCGT